MSSSKKNYLYRDLVAGVYQSLWTGQTYFRHSFVNCCPSNLLSGSLLPPLPPSLCQSRVYRIHYTDSVWLGGVGVLSTVAGV